jgi:hypothetical protein
VHINGEMDEENVVHILHRILFSLEREGNSVTCNHMHKPGGHYAK